MKDNALDMNFFNIVISISQAAMMGMGKISNPQTNKVEKNLNIAKANIDILQMLKDKTEGNLTKKENEILTDTLTSLQLTYADEVKKGTTEEEEDKQGKPAEEEKKEEDSGQKSPAEESKE